MGTKPAAEVRNLKVVRGGNVVLDSLSLDIASGCVTGLIGPSGSGKTTLIRCLVGIQKISSGNVEVLAQPAGTAPLRQRVGYVTQSSSAYPDLSVIQNLRYFGAIAGTDRAGVHTALKQVGLADKAATLVGELSGGQRARVSLAAALLADPDFYLLDEPTVGLDPVLRRDLWQLFGDLAANGKTLLVSSHVMDEAARCDRVLLLRSGAVIADATPDELRTQTSANDLEQAFLILAERQPI